MDLELHQSTHEVRYEGVIFRRAEHCSESLKLSCIGATHLCQRGHVYKNAAASLKSSDWNIKKDKKDKLIYDLAPDKSHFSNYLKEKRCKCQEN